MAASRESPCCVFVRETAVKQRAGTPGGGGGAGLAKAVSPSFRCCRERERAREQGKVDEREKSE